MISIISNGKTYNATIKEDNRGFSVSVFEGKEKLPFCGTRFGLMASFQNQIMPWIKKKVSAQSGIDQHLNISNA